jgi:4,5-DOPA dioxygenase extradiol
MLAATRESRFLIEYQESKMTALPTIFVSHGAPTLAIEPGLIGPRLAALAKSLPRPRAILVVSPHWMTRELRVMTNPAPKTMHDFGGFPRSLYKIRYPAPGSPDIAQDVITALQDHGYAVQADAEEGFDHGAWVPLLHMYPAADIPVVELSMRTHDGPEECFKIGQSLSALREQGVLIIGSGSLTHNLYEFRQGQDTPATYVKAFAFWVRETLEHGDLAALLDYRRSAPHAERAHPTEDHLLPLFFAAGAASQDRGNVRHIDGGISYGILSMDAFVFGNLASGSTATLF